MTPARIPELYAKEYGIAVEHYSEILVKYEVGSPLLVEATHPERCLARGCTTGLYLITKQNCAKQILLFRGDLEPRGPKHEKFEKFAIVMRALKKGEENTEKIYQFEPKTETYKEVK